MKPKNDEAAMKPSYVVGDNDDCEPDHDEDDIYDDVCAICDNGGDVTCCDGKCLRSFHATLKSAKAAKSYCTSLNVSDEEVEGSQPFMCLNCSLEQHQCFVCKELGSSNTSSGAEVFCCSLATCGHFYHPQCVAQLLKGETDEHSLEESITAGESFMCPAHKCHKCEGEENENVEDLQFAICRRCPKSYHRKCLPKDILFDSEDNDQDSDDVTRAWNDLLPKSRALIFCLKHKIDKRMHTAKRDIKFPEIDHIKKKENVVKFDNYTSDDEIVKRRSSRKRVRRSSNTSDNGLIVKRSSSRKRVRMSYKPEPMKKRLKGNLPYHIPVDEDEQTPSTTPMQSEDKRFSLDVDSRERILALVKQHKITNFPSSQASFPKVEESTEAVHLALKKVEEGCNVEDVVVDCKPDDLDQLWKYKDKLKEYLAPFLQETMPMEVENNELKCEVSMETTKVATTQRDNDKTTDEVQHMEVENNELKCEVSMETAEVATTQCDNDKTRSVEKGDGQKKKRKSRLPPKYPTSHPKHSNFEIARLNYNKYAHNTKSGRESLSSQQIGYEDNQRSVCLYKHYTLDQSTCTGSSTPATEKYSPKLDELNHTRINNNRPYAYMDLSGFDPRPYDPIRNLNSTAGWLEE